MKREQPNPDSLLHQQVTQLLSAYLDGQVNARERYWVEQHLSTCPRCRRDLESLRQTVRLLRQLPAVTPPYSFTLRPERVVSTKPPVWHWLFGIPGLATGLAALMCVILLAGVLLYNRLVPHSAVMPLARAPVTYSAPGTPTAMFVPGTVSSATPIASGPAVARDELSLPTVTPMPTSTQVSPIPSQPIELLATSPIPSPEAPVEGYGVPSPAPPMMQPERESAAETQPSPQRTEVPSKAPTDGAMGAQRYEEAVSPEPSWSAPSAIEVTVVPPASEMPGVSLPTEETVMPSGPSSAIGAAAAPPTIGISTTPTPPVEEAGQPPEPSPAAEVMAVPPTTETPAVPTETPVVSLPSQEAVVSAEPSPAAEVMTVPPTTEMPAVPTETSVVSPPSQEAVVSAEPSPAAEVIAVPPTTETPAVPTETPAPLLVEEAPASATEESVPTVPATFKSGTREAPSVSPPESAPTPTRIPISVRDLRLTIKPGLIRIEGALPLPPGQPIQAELWREGEIMEWAIPETQRSKVQEEGHFELELKAQPDHPDFNLFQIPPARYEVRIVPLEFEVPVEARIPFDTFPPATKQP